MKSQHYRREKQMKKGCVVLIALMALMIGVVPALADGPIEGRSGRAEVRFLEGMIDHHQMALDMAQDCLAKAQTETVLTLCQTIIDAQSAEIDLMRGWLLTWYNIDYAPMPLAEMMSMMGEGDEHGGHGGHSTDGPFTDPAMMMGMFAGFNRLEGVDYEIAWLESMIDHHDDALHMAERILLRAPHDEVTTLANAIIEAQTAEIEQMEALIAELGG
jgi:uncharacterized protein (DUF305 family)